jgi:KipI family sensor histidine kinase inhibitor
VVPFGEGALLIEFGDAPDLEHNALAHALSRLLEVDPPPGLRALVPGYVSLVIEFDPLANGVATYVAKALAGLSAAPRVSGRLRHVPVVYGGDYGPDLSAVAESLSLTPEQVVASHTRTAQTVYMLGFAPGHPYLGDLPTELAGLKRLATPRERVPRGSVAIIGRQTVIYPASTPGGWRIIGRTPIDLWAIDRAPPAYFAPGDSVLFEPIDAVDWPRFAGPAADW